jgi:hypothetical protein
MAFYRFRVSQWIHVAGVDICNIGGKLPDYISMGTGHTGIHRHLLADCIDPGCVDHDRRNCAPLPDQDIEPFTLGRGKQF